MEAFVFLNDLEETVAYWTNRDQPERGEQYAHDLPAEAIRQLSDPSISSRIPTGGGRQN
jgi:hypothetical protein